MVAIPRVVEARYVAAHRLEVVFDDGTANTIDFSRWLVGPVFEPLLDEAYFLFNEDVDWCRRAADAGLRIYYDAHAVVVHHIGASKGRLPAWLVLERHKGMFRYYRKHMRRSRWLDVPVALGIALRAGLEILTKSTRRSL